MKRLLHYTAIMLICLFAAEASAALHPAQKKEKYGFVDDDGNIVIKHQFDYAFPFYDGRAKVQKGGKWGYINEDGTYHIKCEYDMIGDFNDRGIARVTKGGKFGYIRQDGSIYIKPDYNFIGVPNEQGYIWVAKGKEIKTALKGLYRDDRLLIKPQYTYLGFYLKTDSVDNTDGRPVNPIVACEIKENFQKLNVSEHPYIWTSQWGLTNFLFDTEGQQLLKVSKMNIGMPHEGFCLANSYSKKTVKYNFFPVTEKSKKLLKKDVEVPNDLKYAINACTPFNGGKALVRNGKQARLIDTQVKDASEYFVNLTPLPSGAFISYDGSLCGMIGADGNEIIRPTYSLIGTPYKQGDCYMAKNTAGKYGFIDANGQEIIPFQYDLATYFYNDRGYVKSGNGWGIINRDNKFTVPAEWDDLIMAHNPEDTHTWGKKGNSWNCIALADGKKAFDTTYDDAGNFDTKGRAFVKKGKMYGIVNPRGEEVVPLMITDFSIVKLALERLDNENLSMLKKADAYRMNLYNHPGRHKYKLKQTVDANMWDY